MSNEARDGRMNPDATPGTPRDVVDPGQLPGAAGKAVGGGLAAGSTDFGPSTAPMHGGHAGAASDTSRTTEVGSLSGGAAAGAGSKGTFGPGPGGASGMTAAGGNSVLNTGRPTRPDARAAIGGEPHTGRTMPDRDNAQSIRSAAGTTGLGTIGGGAAGTGTSGTLDRAADITGDAASAPNFVGANPGQRQDAQIADDEATALKQEMRDARAEMRDAGASSGKGGNPSKRPAD